MNEYTNLIGKYLNGYKIVKVENDPFIKGQINLWTDEQIIESFGDRSIVKFFIREESNTAKIYRELANKENYNLKQALNEIKEYVLGAYEMKTHTKSVCLDEENIEDILGIIEKVSEEE